MLFHPGADDRNVCRDCDPPISVIAKTQFRLRTLKFTSFNVVIRDGDDAARPRCMTAAETRLINGGRHFPENLNLPDLASRRKR
jgi:hypothetical protein